MFPSRYSVFLGALCITLAAAISPGCSSSHFPSSRATISICTDSDPAPHGDVISLLLTVTKIEFQRCASRGVDDGIWTVDVNADNFDPTSLAIRPGGLVQWIWTEDGEHTITGGESAVASRVDAFEGSGSMEGDTFELVFDGVHGETFPYFSNTPADIEAGMAGSIVLDGTATDEDDDGTGSRVTVFAGMRDIDLVDPNGLCEIIGAITVPAGHYCKIRLYVENPRLLLVEDQPFDPEDPPYRTNVNIAGNGRLQIGTSFELVEDGDAAINIIIQDFHLVESGSSGMYILTPQLQATVQVLEAGF